MLRRVARVLRASLFALGVALMLWLPVSIWQRAVVSVVTPHGNVSVSIDRGALVVWTYAAEQPVSYSIDDCWVDSIPLNVEQIREHAVWPWWRTSKKVSVADDDMSIPLWLLAVVCLAWPVTSFVVARRRRRRRGFEVEATAGGAVSTADS